MCHLVTDFAIRSFCRSCMLKNPPGLGEDSAAVVSLGRAALADRHRMFCTDPSNTSVPKPWKSGVRVLPKWPHSASFPPAFVRQLRVLSSECLWCVAMWWAIPSWWLSGTCFWCPPSSRSSRKLWSIRNFASETLVALGWWWLNIWSNNLNIYIHFYIQPVASVVVNHPS